MTRRSRILSDDPITGIRRIHHYDFTNDTSTIETFQDVRHAKEMAQSRFNTVDERANWKGDWHHFADIPLVIWNELQAQGCVPGRDEKCFRKWLNDRNSPVLRMRPGKV